MPYINYIIAGSQPNPKISVLQISLDAPVQAFVDTVYQRHSFNCKISDLEIYCANIASTGDGDLDPEWVGHLDVLCTLPRLMRRMKPLGSYLTSVDEYFVQILVKAPDYSKHDSPDSELYETTELSKKRRPFELLHKLLWHKGDLYNTQIFSDKKAIHAQENQVPITGDTYYTILSLDPLFQTYFKSIPAIADLLPCGGNFLLVRQAYKDMDEALDMHWVHHRKSTRKLGGILITGNPGIGKSFYISYLLVKCLLRGQQVIFQQAGSHCYLFDEKGVQEFTADELYHLNHTTNPYIWALFDTNPPAWIVNSDLKWFIIHASSPQKENYKQWVKQRGGIKYYMSAWSWGEVEMAASLYYPEIQPEALSYIRELYNKYGPTARFLMNEIGNPGPFSKQHEIGNSGPFSKQLDIDLSEGISLFLAKYPDYSTTGSIGTAGSHNVILIVPTNETQQDVTVSILYYTRLATPYIGGKLAELALKHYRQQGRILYQHLFNIPQARTSAGWIFESLVHARLRRGGQMEFIPLARQQLEAPTIINLKKARELQTAAPFHNHSDLNALLREHPESRKPTGKLGILDTYLRPTTASFASIDGLAILSHNYRLVLFQITISADHPISGSGLQKLWDSLPDELRQRNCRGVYFVWVIPRPNEDKSFKVQRITGNEKSEWEQRLIQLRISFEDDDLWCSGG